MSNLRFAVVGDVHGDHWAMIRHLTGWEKARRKSLDFVLQVGDFEPHRHEIDLATMAAPAKYRDPGDFPAFARGDAQFPWPLYFIGGNHEPYGFLDALPNSSHVAAELRLYRAHGFKSKSHGLRVAGLSGIFQPQLFNQTRPDVSQFGTSLQQRLDRLERRRHREFVEFRPRRHLSAARMAHFEFGDNQRHFADVAAREWIELALESLRPELIFCGHLHYRLRSVAFA